MTRLFQLTALFIFFTGWQNSTQNTDSLRSEIEQIVSGKNAVICVSIIGNNGKDTVSFNGNRHCPLQSVFKLHIALAVLAEVDKGKLSLDQEVEIGKKELLTKDFWSPLRDEYPNGGSFTRRCWSSEKSEMHYETPMINRADFSVSNNNQIVQCGRLRADIICWLIELHNV